MRSFISYKLEAMKKARDVPLEPAVANTAHADDAVRDQPDAQSVTDAREHETNRRKMRAMKVHPVVLIFWG
jgi:hypothetical protein